MMFPPPKIDLTSLNGHTPGPWIAVGRRVEHPTDSVPDICTTAPEAMDQNGRSDAECCANARLIAAAPLLLAEVATLRDRVRELTLYAMGVEAQRDELAAWKSSVEQAEPVGMSSGTTEWSFESGQAIASFSVALPSPAHPAPPAGTKLYTRPAPAAAPEQHPDDTAVDRFSFAMKHKLAAARAKGRGGWDDPEQCSVEMLARMLVEHVAKGDPVDVANFALMLHQRGADAAVLAAAAAPERAEPTPDMVDEDGDDDAPRMPGCGVLPDGGWECVCGACGDAKPAARHCRTCGPDGCSDSVACPTGGAA